MVLWDISFYNNIQNTLDIGNRVGLTDYIDFLKDNEITHNLMKGVDIYKRKFIVMKVGIMNPETGELYRLKQVFFQRYINELHDWMTATIIGNVEFMYSYGGMKPIQYKMINDLVNGKTVMVEDCHRLSSPDFTGYVIATMDTWEKKYAKVIQRAFLVCRYDPNYTICKNILKRQYDEYIEGIQT